MADTGGRRRRGGGRAGAAARRGSAALEQMPWNPPINIDRPIEPLTEEGVQAIHDGAMRILEEIGIQFYNEEALEIFKEAGVKVEGDLVKMDRDFVMEMVAKAPSEWTITPRNPDRTITPLVARPCCSGMCLPRPTTGIWSRTRKPQARANSARTF